MGKYGIKLDGLNDTQLVGIYNLCQNMLGGLQVRNFPSRKVAEQKTRFVVSMINPDKRSGLFDKVKAMEEEKSKRVVKEEPPIHKEAIEWNKDGSSRIHVVDGEPVEYIWPWSDDEPPFKLKEEDKKIDLTNRIELSLEARNKPEKSRSKSYYEKKGVHLSKGEQELLRYIPTDGSRFTTVELSGLYYKDRTVLNGRIIILGRLKSIAQKAEIVDYPWRLHRSQNEKPIQFWIEHLK